MQAQCLSLLSVEFVADDLGLPSLLFSLPLLLLLRPVRALPEVDDLFKPVLGALVGAALSLAVAATFGEKKLALRNTKTPARMIRLLFN
jgi:hypothetical protein